MFSVDRRLPNRDLAGEPRTAAAGRQRPQPPVRWRPRMSMIDSSEKNAACGVTMTRSSRSNGESAGSSS